MSNKIQPEDCPYPVPTSASTVGELKKYLYWFLENGLSVPCPCCAQHAQVYSRKVTGVMIRQLLELYKREGTWVTGRELQQSTDGSARNYSLMRFWGLIQPGDNHSWQITDKGKAFIEGKIEIEEVAHVYNNKLQGFSKEMTTVDEAYGESFNLEKLLKPEIILADKND